ncbi:MAG TPA: SusD/RagB family nutrient-binding outer membrane lipoprotein [Chitinophagales bacterium]|nr:SusD/RagB family nutrient-binding outer membrane lipoprotein [Chitinophagales bacterium]
MKKLLFYIPMLLLAFGFVGCEKFTEGYSENPNNATTPPPGKLMITGVELADVLASSGEMARLAGMWSGQFTGADRQYISLNSYNATSGDFDSPWGVIYAGGVGEARLVKANADATLDKAMKGAALVLEAHMLGTAAALWGDVPFDQAGDVENFPAPAYEPQEQVYQKVQTLLTDALANVSGTSYATATTMGSWAEVAHSLKARYHLHLGHYDMALDEAMMGISTPDRSWQSIHNCTALGDINIYAYFIDYERSGYLGAADAHAVALLDPAGSKYRGNAKTDESGRFAWYYTADGYTALDPNFIDGAFTECSNFVLFSWEENQLIMAESYARLGNDDDALAALNLVRSYNDAFFGAGDGSTYAAYDLADFAAGGIANRPGKTASESLLLEILEEKYLNTIGQIEAFNDLRRTDNAIGVPGNDGKPIPQRFLYSQNEINSNPSTPNPVPSLNDPTPVND